RVLRCPAWQVESQALVQVVLLDVRQEQGAPAPAGQSVPVVIGVADAVGSAGLLAGAADIGRRKAAIGSLIVVKRQPDLFEVVLASHSIGCFADFLPRRQKNAE